MATCFNLVAFVPCYSYLVGAHVLFFFYPYVRVFSPIEGSGLPSGIKLLMFYWHYGVTQNLISYLS